MKTAAIVKSFLFDEDATASNEHYYAMLGYNMDNIKQVALSPE